MHYVQAKSILSARNGMNLYRGCQHGCIYCDSRSSCYQMNHIFEDIEVKENGLLLLEQTLKNKRKKCMIGTGAMSDPYTPLEMKLGYTRRALELIDRYGFGISIQTKSDRILRDLDLLSSINSRTKAVVQMTLTTWDPQLCRILEPNVCNTQQRLDALVRFREAGIPTVVWLCPLVPWLNDTPENLLAILQACKEVGVVGIVNFGMGLTLRDGNREYFYAQLDRFFPGLKEQYIRTYGNAYEIPSPRWQELNGLFHRFCEEKGILHDNDRIFAYMAQFEEKEEQISLF